MSFRPMSLSYYPSTCNFIRGSQCNLERIYLTSTYLKAKGGGELSQTFIPTNLCVDLPFMYSFNRPFTAFTENQVSSLIQVGANLRYEASLLNTVLRREQTRHGLSYYTVGSFTALRYSHSHLGNSIQSLFSINENRNPFIKDLFAQVKPTSILSSINSFRNHNSVFRYNFLRQLGKQFFIKTPSKDRFGFVHSSVGSLSFAHLGIVSNKIKSDYSATFTLAQPEYFMPARYENKLFDSSKAQVNQQSDSIVNIQAKTLYECTGYLIAIQGQRRKHIKVVNPVPIKGKVKSNFEAELISF